MDKAHDCDAPGTGPVRRLLPLVAGGLLVCGCVAPDPGPPGGVPFGDPYDLDRMLEVEFEMEDDDWEALRSQSRHYLDLIGASCNEAPTVSPYTWFRADIYINGVLVEDVGVRKKGFYGSVSTDKPSLKVKFDEYVQGQRFAGLEQMTLNNNLGDPSQIKQCLGYSLYSDAGVPAPRCSFATVDVNGEQLATYTHLEPIKKPFLGRHFEDDDGNLYEGALSDFRPGWIDTFERKTNEDDPDRSDIEVLVPALQVSDDVLLETIEPLIDVEAFLDMWAMEVLLMHGDGYARNTNNFYLYNDPTTGRFTFIPWGIDVILQPDQTWDWEQAPPPGVAWAEGMLSRRLYMHPDSQAAYLARIETLLDEVWIEDQILDDIDRMQETWAPFITGYQEFIAESVDGVRDYVSDRRAQLEPLLAEPPAPWDRPLRDPWCLGANGSLAGDFDGRWDTLDVADPFGEGSGTLDLHIDAEELSGEGISVTAGQDTSSGQGLLRLLIQVEPERSFVVVVDVDMDLLDGPLPTEVAIGPAGGTLFEVVDPMDGSPPVVEARAYLDGGTLYLDEASPDSLDPFVGSLDAELYPVLD